jgi:hypothetical protein
MDARVKPAHDDGASGEEVMAAYDNLLANVPTDLWING